MAMEASVPMVLSARQLLARAADSDCGSRANRRKDRVICPSGTPVLTAIGAVSNESGTVQYRASETTADRPVASLPCTGVNLDHAGCRYSRSTRTGTWVLSADCRYRFTEFHSTANFHAPPLRFQRICACSCSAVGNCISIPKRRVLYHPKGHTGSG